MTRFQGVSCWMYEWLLLRLDDSLLFTYGDEIRAIVQQEIVSASERGPSAVCRLWQDLLWDSLTVLGPEYLRAVGLTIFSAMAAGALVAGTALGFCSFHSVPVVRGCERSGQEPSTPGGNSGQTVTLADGHKMFLECSSADHDGPTVILGTGRGLGSYEAWSAVKARIAPFAHVCSYDPLGYGKSDHVPGTHPIDDVVGNMHELFGAAHLHTPYVLVGASLGGVLIRRYEQQYPSEVAGFVFVDSAHEEMEWRDAQISPAFDAHWNDPKYLRENGLLAAEQRFAWHDDVPLIVLERTDLSPCGAFPGLTQPQCDELNKIWHDMQVDLSKRSKYAELRPIAASGHAMQQQKPEAIARAVHDVLDRVPAVAHGETLVCAIRQTRVQ